MSQFESFLVADAVYTLQTIIRDDPNVPKPRPVHRRDPQRRPGGLYGQRSAEICRHSYRQVLRVSVQQNVPVSQQKEARFSRRISKH